MVSQYTGLTESENAWIIVVVEMEDLKGLKSSLLITTARRK